MLFRKLFFKKYDEFALKLGFSDWRIAYENTFFIYRIPEDAQWNATQLPNKSWAVWNDIGQPPYSFKVFETWKEAIRYLRNLFDDSELPEHYWYPEGFDLEENVFKSLPNKEKKL
ncbi:hypothetical protein JOC85_002610 [Bacillus mesophilus]|uniref:Uncharacterized protein n=1 Tax=Bacillus mesophilus TaxID=1808955 RepID=A0A6M0QCY8_9BACI|nr:hypothetical protein [Bacillus mesophilus]MBM7661803.1 hypothetical protein [Bacillus mesophilus]NEY74214.1 hypothetical protein [Bacillus mesophilus]